MATKRISTELRQLIASAVAVGVFLIGLHTIDAVRDDFVSAIPADAVIPGTLHNHLTLLGYGAILAGCGAGCIVNFWLALSSDDPSRKNIL